MKSETVSFLVLIYLIKFEIWSEIYFDFDLFIELDRQIQSQMAIMKWKLRNS